jgi:hypothetical protein
MKQRGVKPGKFGYDELCTLLEAAVSHSALLSTSCTNSSTVQWLAVKCMHAHMH